jgi:putative tryptophan/tyrosine transport system substrate-binding protein
MQFDQMRRRNFITLLGGTAAAWPLAARAQQPAMPVIGFLHPASPDANADRLRAFRLGLRDAGLVEGHNVAIEYRWANNQIDRLPELAEELVGRQVGAIVAISHPAVLAAKRATATIPIVFMAAEDPVKQGLVTSLARPGGNLTGVNFFAAELAAKRLELLRELVPDASNIAVLVDPTNRSSTESTLRDVEVASQKIGLQIQVLNVSTSHEIDAAFAPFVSKRPDALFIGSATSLMDRRVQLALLAAAHKVPATYPWRDFVEAGGLISYGASLRDAYSQTGIYAARILKGAKPAELPVMQSTRFELVINAQTARILGLTVPQTLLATADEVIE